VLIHTLLCQLQLDLPVFLQLHVCEKLRISSFSQGFNLHPIAQAAELPPSLQKGTHLLSETRSGRQV
jgi:hypothetical protein